MRACLYSDMPFSRYSTTFNKLLDTSRIRRATKGEVIATTESISGVFSVRKGFVKRFNIKNDGSISVQEIYGPGDCFGITSLSSLLLRNYIYSGLETYYYEAINETRVHELDVSLLIESLHAHQELYKDLFIIQSWHSLSDVWMHESRSLDTATKRVAHIICFYLERYGVRINSWWELKVPLIQQDLADILGLTRETVSLAVSELKNEGLLVKHRQVRVTDIKALRERAYS